MINLKDGDLGGGRGRKMQWSGGTFEVCLWAPREADETYQVWYLPVYLRPSGVVPTSLS